LEGLQLKMIQRKSSETSRPNIILPVLHRFPYLTRHVVFLSYLYFTWITHDPEKVIKQTINNV
jgi:hypothetical protein